jgi:hypothetical protein
MEPHARPDYEIALDRIAAKLDVIVEAQSKHVPQMRQVRETSAPLIIASIEKRLDQPRQALDRVDALLRRMDIKSAESEMKLRALTALMNRRRE